MVDKQKEIRKDKKEKKKKEGPPIVKVGKQGRITIPKEIREKMGIEVGDYVMLKRKENYLEIHPIKLKGDEE